MKKTKVICSSCGQAFEMEIPDYWSNDWVWYGLPGAPKHDCQVKQEVLPDVQVTEDGKVVVTWN